MDLFQKCRLIPATSLHKIHLFTFGYTLNSSIYPNKLLFNKIPSVFRWNFRILHSGNAHPISYRFTNGLRMNRPERFKILCLLARRQLYYIYWPPSISVFSFNSSFHFWRESSWVWTSLSQLPVHVLFFAFITCYFHSSITQPF